MADSMTFQVDPRSYRDIFSLPSEVAKRLKLAGEKQLRFIIRVFYEKAEVLELSEIAKATGMSESDAEECLIYWQNAGLIVCDNAPEEKVKTVTKTAVAHDIEKPNKVEAVKIASKDDAFRMILPEIQRKLGRTINSNELASFVWMYDSLGLPTDVLLMLVEFCISEDRKNIAYMEKIALDWAKNDIDTAIKAEEMLKARVMSKKAWGKVEKAFGIESRKPSDKELLYSDRWINEWGFSSAMLKAAYNTCIDSKAKLSFAYVNSILNSWHEKGYKTVEETEKQVESKKKSTSSSIDMDKFSTALKNRKRGDDK